jgi:hypothetical protein
VRRTPFDWLLLIFFITAVVGVWAAYDRSRAWLKFGIIIAAIVLFYILAWQRRRNVWWVSGLLGITSSLIAAYFLLTHDWGSWPADIDILNRIGVWWMGIRPPVSLLTLHPNIAGGMIAMLLPFLIAIGVYGYEKQQSEIWGPAFIFGGLALTGLVMTSSRAAWLALIGGLGIWLVWEVSDRVTAVIPFSRQKIFIFAVSLMTILGIALSYSVGDGPLSLAGSLPGQNNVTSRLDLFRDTVDLIGDFPFTGGGLGAFPGLYSQYLAVTPFFQFDYSHNLWLDVALEQSPIGLLSFMGLVVGSGVLLWRTAAHTNNDLLPEDLEAQKRWLYRQQFRRELKPFRWAATIALLVMVYHGLVDDPLYGGVGTPLLFVVPGIVVATSRRQEVKRLLPSMPGLKPGLAWVVGLALVGVGLRLAAAEWKANLGAVFMARTELAGWPTGEWDDGHHVSALDPAATLFTQVVDIASANRTARHRLGLIAMLRQDFGTAVTHLKIAHKLDPDHRGILKTLGYSYVWIGEFDQAAALLKSIPESDREMNVYTGWWLSQGREDLSKLAVDMANLH